MPIIITFYLELCQKSTRANNGKYDSFITKYWKLLIIFADFNSAYYKPEQPYNYLEGHLIQTKCVTPFDRKKRNAQILQNFVSQITCKKSKKSCIGDLKDKGHAIRMQMF